MEVLTLDSKEAVQGRERQKLCCSITCWRTKERLLISNDYSQVILKKKKKSLPLLVKNRLPMQETFRKMVMMTLYARQQKRHRGNEQTFGL